MYRFVKHEKVKQAEILCPDSGPVKWSDYGEFQGTKGSSSALFSGGWGRSSRDAKPK